MKRFLLFAVILGAGCYAYWQRVADLIDPVFWEAPPPPALRGPLLPNNDLGAAECFGEGIAYGPEDVAVDPAGRVHVGTASGRIIRFDNNLENPQTLVMTWGRPLGLHFDEGGRLIVADADNGLLAVTAEGETTTLSRSANGTDFGFTNDLDIASDGMIYFSDASSRFHQKDYLLALLENRPHGRLMRHDPATGQTTVLLDGLHFANGVALSMDEDFVLVNETYRYRIIRYWLKGPNAGTAEIFADNLPGMPDGVSSNREGVFWVAMATPRKGIVDWLHRQPRIKTVMAGLPRAWLPKPDRYGLVLALGENGNTLGSLHDPLGKRSWLITSVEQVEDRLFLGTLHDDRICHVPVPGALRQVSSL